jgi:hypothetical protein
MKGEHVWVGWIRRSDGGYPAALVSPMLIVERQPGQRRAFVHEKAGPHEYV